MDLESKLIEHKHICSYDRIDAEYLITPRHNISVRYIISGYVLGQGTQTRKNYILEVYFKLLILGFSKKFHKPYFSEPPCSISIGKRKLILKL